MASIGRTSTPTSVTSGNTFTDRPANQSTLQKIKSQVTSPFPPSSSSQSNQNDTADSADRLIHELSAHQTHTLPLWAQMTKLNPPEPNPQCKPYVWRYKDVRPYLIRAGELITEKQAERRVLMLVNPARNEAPYTTDTIYGGLQLVMPNETAPAHRHVAFAMRFIVEGDGGFTAVHGKRVTMKRGDVILTPVWNWHDHGNGGDKPMIWLDGLDLPLFRHFPVHFVEHFKEPRYPAEDVDSNNSPIVFPWHKMKGRLDSNTDKSWCRERYLREDGSEVSRTLGAAAERLAPNTSSPWIQEVTSSIYHVIQGSGHTIIKNNHPPNSNGTNGSSETKLTWTTGDTFAIPTWTVHKHVNGTDNNTNTTNANENIINNNANANTNENIINSNTIKSKDNNIIYLYRCDDVPMMKSLGFYRTKDLGGPKNGTDEGTQQEEEEEENVERFYFR